MEEGIFYKRGSKSDFAGADMLPNGEDIPRIIITDIRFHETITVNGRPDKERWTAHFAENPFCNKPFLLNATNKARIAKAFWNTPVEDGTPCAGRINLLHNIAVRLTSEIAKDVANGGETLGLRISKYAAASDEEMNQWLIEHGFKVAPAAPAKKKVVTEDKIQKTIDWAKEKGMTFEQVAERFEFADETVAIAVQDGLTPAAPAQPEPTDNDLPE